MPRKANQSLSQEIGQEIKMKRETKDLGVETHPGEGVMKEEKFPDNRKPSHSQVHGEFWNLREKHNWKKQTNKQNPHRTHLTAITSGEMAQRLLFTNSKWGLGREMRAASLVLRLRTGFGCPEDNLRGLM